MEVLTSVDRERIARLRESDEFFFLDLVKPSAEEIDAFGDALELHPVALEDTREFGQRPKLDTYGDHVLFVFYTVRSAETSAEGLFEPVEVHVYISGGYIVSIRRQTGTDLDGLHDKLEPEDTSDEGYLIYRIFDVLTDAFYPVIELLESRIDALEGEVLSRPSSEQLEQIYRIKQEVVELLRHVTPARDAFQTGTDTILSLSGLSRGAHEYLRDVGDHLAQIAGELQRQQEDLTALTSTYFNANTNRLNTTVTRLTVIATFFIIWTLVTGFFGQNFGWLVDNVDTRTDFLLFGLGALVAPTVVVGGVFWVKRKDWF